MPSENRCCTAATPCLVRGRGAIPEPARTLSRVFASEGASHVSLQPKAAFDCVARGSSMPATPAPTASATPCPPGSPQTSSRDGQQRRAHNSTHSATTRSDWSAPRGRPEHSDTQRRQDQLRRRSRDRRCVRHPLLRRQHRELGRRLGNAGFEAVTRKKRLYRIRRALLIGREHLTDRQRQRLEKYLPVGDPRGRSKLTGDPPAGPLDPVTRWRGTIFSWGRDGSDRPRRVV